MPCRTCRPWLLLFALLIPGVSVFGQEPGRARRPGPPLGFTQERYRVGAGEAVPVAVQAGTAEFIRKARSSRVRAVVGETEPGLVVGPGVRGEAILLGASLLAEPGLHRVSVEVEGDDGEVRLAGLEVEVEALRLPSAASAVPPVILLNGFQGTLLSNCPVSQSSGATFGKLEQLLGREVWFFDNCKQCPTGTIEACGAALGSFLRVLAPTSPLGVDVVGHSMGGLIIRSYLAGKQQSRGSFIPVLEHRIRKAVFISTPHFGSSMAFNAGSQLRQMVPGSEFLMDLATWNQQMDDLRGVDSVAIAANPGNSTIDDGVVAVTSQSLGFAAYDERTRVLPYCHSTFGLAWSLVTGCRGDGIADIGDANHPSLRIIRSFLADSDEWRGIGWTPSQDPHLGRYGGFSFLVKTESDTILSDLSGVTAFPSIEMISNANSFSSGNVLSGSYRLSFNSASRGALNANLTQLPAGRHTVGVLKMGTSVRSVGPVLPSPARGLIVESGANITIRGVSLGSAAARVFAGNMPLNVVSASDSEIVAFLPATFQGWVPITVVNGMQQSRIGVMVAAPNPPRMVVALQQLSFAGEEGAGSLAAQTVQISNAGGGTLTWSASSSASWLRVTPASGVAPGTVTVTANVAGLAAGSYSTSLVLGGQVSIPVSLRVSAVPVAPMTVSPRSVSFTTAVGGTLPAAQSLSVGSSAAMQWSVTSRVDWLSVSPASGTGNGSVQIAMNANARVLARGSYSTVVTVATQNGQLQDIPVALTVLPAAAPTVTVASVVNGATFQTAFSPGSWVSIVGQNLSASTRVWRADDFVNGRLPTVVDGVSVTINGLPAYVYFVSPGQLNVLAADDPSLSVAKSVVVRVRTASGEGSATVLMQPLAPGFFGNGAGGVAAVHRDGSLNAALHQYPGSRPAAPNELVSLYLTGLGQTAPAYPDGRVLAGAAPLGVLPRVSVGGERAEVLYAGLVSPGLYQVNLIVPASVATGRAAVQLQMDGTTATATGTLTVARP